MKQYKDYYIYNNILCMDNKKWYDDNYTKLLMNNMYFPLNDNIENNITSNNFNKLHFNGKQRKKYSFDCISYKNHQSKKFIEKLNPTKCKENNTKSLKSCRFGIKFTKKQKQIIFKWFNVCDKVYNECVKEYNTNKKFDLNYKKSKLLIFNKLFGDKKKPCPYDILTDEVRKFCSNVKSALSNLKNNNIKKFKISKLENKYGRSILIPHKSITEDGIFINKLGKIEDFNIINIHHDCRLVYVKRNDHFYLYIPYGCKIKENNNQSVVALDPGEKIFQTYYSLDTCGKICENLRDPILEHEKTIRKTQRILSQNKNKEGRKIKHKKQLKIRIQNEYEKIHNLVDEVHHKTAKFLCENFKRIMIPVFRTKEMIKNIDHKKIKKQNKEKISDMLKECENKEDYRKVTKTVRLDKRVKFVLNMERHYEFRQFLAQKCKEYNCELIIVTEEYTSKCCGKCGAISDNYNNRIKTCEKCKTKINRDLNGARNILIKNFSKVYKKVRL